MGKLYTTAVLLAFALFSSPTQARTATDCPLRDAPYSVDSPIIDILISPAAQAAIVAEDPKLLNVLPSEFFSTQTPTFAAIFTIRKLAEMKSIDAKTIARLNDALLKIPVSAKDRVTRCARYDDERPTFTLPRGNPRILLFEKINGYRDAPSVDAADLAFKAMAQQNGWAIISTDKGGAITPSVLRQFDTIIWNNISGDVLTLSQRRALKSYIEQGGGFIGIHGSAGDPATFWSWYNDSLIGARFAGHPMKPQFQNARIMVADRTHPLAKGLPNEWVMNDEWYSFTSNPRLSGANILATLDEDSYSPEGLMGENLRMGEHPIAWSRCIGRGRMFYSAIGHRPETYKDPHYVQMLQNAVGWTSGKKPCSKRPAQ